MKHTEIYIYKTQRTVARLFSLCVAKKQKIQIKSHNVSKHDRKVNKACPVRERETDRQSGG